MPKVDAGRVVGGVALTFIATVVGLHGCREQPTEPASLQTSAAGSRGHHLKLVGDGSTASGTLTMSRGGFSCQVSHAGGQVTATGTCEATIPKGTLVVITADPGPEGGTVTWTGCDHAHPDDPLSCRALMNGDRSIGATFAPRPTSYLLTVQGGSGGSGSVHSTPAGIACNLAGSNKSGCSARFPTSSTVTLTASTSRGKPLKAWAGGECETRGNGIGATRGSCSVTMSEAQSVVVSFEAELNEAQLGSWEPPTPWPHVAIHAALLPNGKVITWGRRSGVPVLWDPAAPGTFVSLPRPADFFCTGHSFLPNGRLILTGGHDGAADFGLRKTYIFNHTLNTWSAGKRMANGRWYPTTTTLASGQILTISGGDTNGVLNEIPELRLTSGKWKQLTGATRAVPYYPMMFVAPNGLVFMAGPEQQSMYLNPAGTGSWTAGPLSSVSERTYGSAVMYDAGKILLVGGNEANPTNVAEIIDLNAGSGAAWQATASMAVGRRQSNATILGDGTVLVTGGTDAPGFNEPPTDNRVLTPERWDPDAGTWTQLSPMAHHRLYHATTLLLPDGRLWSGGSGEGAATGLPNDRTAEIFSPPYLFNPDGSPATRPSIGSAPNSVGYGQAFTVETEDAASISRVLWIRLGSGTHSFDQNQRANRLTFSSSSATALSITAPSGRNLAPPGHYMLFIINSAGVPSVARIIQIS